MYKFKRPSTGTVIATGALVLAASGTAGAAGMLSNGSVHTAQLHAGAVTSQKIHRGAVSYQKLSMGVQGLIKNKSVVSPGPQGPQGPKGATGSTGATGATGATGSQGATGAQGPAGTPILYESTQTDAPDLALDAAPGPDGSAGSSGWGWDSNANGPVTSLTVGSTNTFTVTVLQPNSEAADGSVTVSYDPYDFTLNGTPADGTCSLSTGEMSCSFTDLAHSAKSIGLSFTANNADPDAVIGVQAIVAGESATQQVPVAITG
jgi:hypothetical protein